VRLLVSGGGVFIFFSEKFMPEWIMYLKILLFILLIRRLMHIREITILILSALPGIKNRHFTYPKNLTCH